MGRVSRAWKPIRPAISVIIPAYNEEAAVGSQIVSIREVLRSHGIEHEIIVVDDGSVDATAEKAIEAGARVLQKPQNQGYGAALKTGIVAAKHDTIVMIDADGTYPADQIPHLVSQVGNRRYGGRGSYRNRCAHSVGHAGPLNGFSDYWRIVFRDSQFPTSIPGFERFVETA